MSDTESRLEYEQAQRGRAEGALGVEVGRRLRAEAALKVALCELARVTAERDEARADLDAYTRGVT